MCVAHSKFYVLSHKEPMIHSHTGIWDDFCCEAAIRWDRRPQMKTFVNFCETPYICISKEN